MAKRRRKSRRPRRAKRAATLRRGFQYQDLIAADSLLLMLADEVSGPVTVSLEDRHSGSFDDVVEHYSGHVRHKQVKWSTNPLGKPYTLDNLGARQGSSKTSLIKAFATSWRALRQGHPSIELHLISNRHPDEELRGLLEDDPARISTTLSKARKKRVVSAWQAETGLASTTFWKFVRSLRFGLDAGDLSQRERTVKATLATLGAPTDAFSRLIEAIQEWSTNASTRYINSIMVLDAIGLSSKIPDNRFSIDHRSLVARSSVQASLAALVQSHAGQYVAVLGTPGAGKSTVLNSIAPPAELASRHILIVYNCFTGPGDSSLAIRAATTNLEYFVIQELHRQIPGQFARYGATPSAFEQLLQEASAAAKPKRVVLVIDGLDYAAANRQPDRSNLWEALPRKLPDNMTVVVSAQTVGQLPEHLQELPRTQQLHVPPLSAAQTRTLLQRLQVFTALSATTPYQRDEVTSAVYGKAKGHALFTVYAARWLLSNPVDADKARTSLDTLPACDGDVRDWYQHLRGIQDAYGQALLREMAFCPFPLSPHEADSLVIDGRGRYAAEDVLKQLAFLFQVTGTEWSFRHDSLRAWSQQRLAGPTPTAAKYFEWLTQRPNDPRVGEYAASLAVDAHRRDWAAATIDGDWVATQLATGCLQWKLEQGITRLLKDAVIGHDWPRASKWALLLQRMNEEVGTVETEVVDEYWLASKRPELVLRGAVEGDRLLISPAGAIRLADRLEEAGYDDDAAPVVSMAIAMPLDDTSQMHGGTWDDDVYPFVSRLAQAVSVSECLIECKAIAHKAAADGVFLGPVTSAQLLKTLVLHAAYACLWEQQYSKVREWCRQTVSALRKADVHLLLAVVDLKENKATSSHIAHALKHSPPLWFIALASRHASWAGSCSAVLGTAAPSLQLYGQLNYMHIAKEVTDAVSDLSTDCRLSSRLGLTGRVQSIQKQIRVPPLKRDAFMYAATVNTMLAPRGVAGLTQWRPMADAFRDTVRRSQFDQLPLRDQYDTLGLGSCIRFLLDKIEYAAAKSNDRKGFATWLGEELRPALQTVRLVRDEILEVVNLEFFCLNASPAERTQLLNDEEQHLGVDISHKSRAYWVAARAAAAAGDATQATRLLQKGFRASLTYGYRKDVTILVYHDLLALLLPRLGDQALDAVALAAATLEIINALTDHKELHYAGADFVSALATYNVDLAAFVAKTLFRRVNGRLFGGGVGAALRERGVDPHALYDALCDDGDDTVCIELGLNRSAPKPVRAPPGGTLPALLAKLVKLIREPTTESFDERQELVTAILARVADRQSFEEVKRVFEAQSGQRVDDRIKLVQRALLIGLADEANALGAAVAHEAFSSQKWYWSFDRHGPLRTLASANPQALLREVQDAAARSVDDMPQYMGIHFSWSLAQTLLSNGDIIGALGVFHEYAAHLRQLMAPYPTSMEWWRDQLKDKVQVPTKHS